VSSHLFPEPAIAAWLDAKGIAPGESMRVEQIEGGRSNVMFRVHRGGERLVLRRPTRVALAKADDGMRREFRILRALAPTDVPVPEPVALCDDLDVIGSVFYLMAEVDGVPPTALPVGLGEASTARRTVTEAVTDALASLHEVDYIAAGLEGFGTPDGFHERQASRWTRQYEEVGGRHLADVGRIGSWLSDHLPTDWSPTIIHADYHMLNVLIAPDPPARVAAIVDWETSTIGDPLLDLAGFCEVWCGAYSGDGWPNRGEIVERYASARCLGELPDLRYYEVLYNFRLAVLLEGVYLRSVADRDRQPDGTAEARAMHNLRRAVELAE